MHSSDHTMVYDAIKENVPGGRPTGWELPILSMLNSTGESDDMKPIIYSERIKWKVTKQVKVITWLQKKIIFGKLCLKPM